MPPQQEKNSTSSTKPYTDPDWLRDAYTTKSINEIAAECAAAPTTIRKYLKRFGIKSRSVSESMKLKYQDDEYSEKKHEQCQSDAYKEKHRSIAAENVELKSEISKKLWKDKEFKKKQKDHRHTDEAKGRISTAIKKKWESAEYRDRQMELQEDHAKIFSSIMTEMWQDDEYRVSKTTSNIAQGELRRLTTQEFTTRAESIHGDTFDYSDVEYINYDRDKVKIRCADCGHYFYRIPGNHLKKVGCPKCKTSQGQKEIYDFIVTTGIQCVLNDRTRITPYELDIFVPKLNLAVEYHGLRWHSHDRPESSTEKLYAQNKYKACSDVGIRLLQIFDYQWQEKQEIVQSIILNRLGLSYKYDARKLDIKDVKETHAKEFFNNTHLKGHRGASITIGLYDINELIMAISLSKRGDCHEIIRMASKLNSIVRGGVSRLISTAISRVGSIMTYADLMHSDGAGYRHAGMELTSITKPGYFYYKGTTRLSRQQCQKHKLHKLLKHFDPSLSESMNMFNSGYRRVWDAGHLKLRINQ